MMWQSEPQMKTLAQNVYTERQWQHDFVAEWHRLSEGCADLEQTTIYAIELYAAQGTRNPVEVAREELGT